MARWIRRGVDAAEIPLLAVGLIALALLSGCSGGRRGGGSAVNAPPASNVPVNAPSEPRDGAEQVELKRIRIPFSSADGKTAGLITADSAEGDLKAGTATLKNVSLRARREGKANVSARAQTARVRTDARSVEMAGGVVFDMPDDGASVSARTITWNWHTGDYVGTGDVRLRMNGAVGKGGRVVGNTRTGHVTLEG